MIENDKEFEVTQERIKHFQSILQKLRQSARPEEFEAISSSYRLEIERMQAEIMEYLLTPVYDDQELLPVS